MNLIAFGINTLENLINSDFFEFKKIIVIDEKEKEYAKFLKQLAVRKIEHEIVTKEQFGRHIPDRKHQGIIAFIKSYTYCSLKFLINKKPNKRVPLIVMLDSIEDPHNFGAVIRSCAAMNVDGIIIANKQQVPVNSTVIKVSVGGVSYVPVCQVSNLEEALNTLKIAGYSIISTVCDSESVDYEDLNTDSPLCVIFGNEHEGIKKRIIKKSDQLISIPLENDMNSLNISVSCGVIISSISRKLK